MANRIFVFAVMVLWLGSMSWLMVDKVLPSWYDAEPPIPAGFEPGVPVAWKVTWAGKPVGQAASIRRPGPQGTTNLESRVVLEDVPLLDLAPPWMRSVVGDIGRLKFDSWSRLEFDSLDNFSSFTSRIGVNDIPGVLQMTGRINGSFLELTIRGWGDLNYSPKVPAPDQAVLREALFPDSKLPYMYVGRRWREETYSPFRSPGDPMESIEAEVTGVESLQRDDKSIRVMRVEFRSPPGPGIPDEARLQAVAWVVPQDGTVLQQDVHLGASKLRFERLSNDASSQVGADLLHPDSRGRRWGRHGSHSKWISGDLSRPTPRPMH
jgi:hypothetical protein